jgi:hypothetical protein
MAKSTFVQNVQKQDGLLTKPKAVTTLVFNPPSLTITIITKLTPTSPDHLPNIFNTTNYRFF